MTDHLQGSRRNFLKTAGIAAASLSLADLPGILIQARPTGKPNIIYIMADDLGYGELSCYGQTKYQTPNIDRLAREGMKFTQHYAGVSLCAPSRSSLMTGLHTGHTRIRNNFTAEGGRGALQPGDLTVAEVLKRAGYATGIVGKWGLGDTGTTGAPNKKGFSFWYGFTDQSLAHNQYPPKLWRNDEEIVIEGNQGAAKGQYAHDLFTKEAHDFIRRSKHQPFFLYLAYTLPHSQLEVPEDSLREFRGKFPRSKPVEGSFTEIQNPNETFAAMVTRLDRDVGRLVVLLKELKLEEQTLVIFTTDNGAHNVKGKDPRFFNSSGGLRGIKRDLYEGGIRVPFIARWPGKIKSGSISNHVSAFWDFLPTVAELAGAQVPKRIDGISYLPALLGKRQPEHKFLYFELEINTVGSQAMRFGDWKAVRHSKYGPIELYNLKQDIGEQNDLAIQRPEVVKQIEAHLKTSRVDSTQFPLWPQGKSKKDNSSRTPTARWQARTTNKLKV